MTKTRSTKRALLMSALALVMCISMLVGSTFAWFTDSVTSGNNKIVAGNLDVVLEYKTDWSDDWTTVDENTKIFKEGALYEPGYTEVVYLRVSNAGSLALKYNLMVNVTSEKESTNVYGDKFKLSDYLQIGTYMQDEYSSGYNYADILMPYMFGTREAALAKVSTPAADVTPLTKLSAANSIVRSNSPVLAGEQTAQVMAIVLTMPETVGNEANHKAGVAAPELNLGISLVATQYTDEYDSFGNQYDKNAEYPVIPTADTWDGTADTSWYNDTDAEFNLTTAEALAGFGKLVDEGNTFYGKTVKLGADIDLYAEDANGNQISFNPIGYGYNTVFKGTFDGQDHTVLNLYQNGWALGYDYSTEAGGLFASVVDATIKNVTVDNANIVMECIDMGVLVGYSYGNCTYENITISNSSIQNYNRYTGGVVGEVNGTQIFKNVDVDATTTVSTLWGSFDTSVGGIIGGKYGDAQLTFEDCDVACRIDAYNDVTATPARQWYSYRRAGMLIGNSEESKTENGRTVATATYLTATNCTVTYGEWANYTYCEFNNMSTSWPHCRVQAGGQSSAYTNARYGVAKDLNGNTVVDDNHVHADGEDHNLLLVFDQLFGGDVGVYGGTTHDGVTVIYNN